MTRTARLLLVIFGLLLIGISISALIYAWAPVELVRDQVPLAPTLFVLPPGSVP